MSWFIFAVLVIVFLCIDLWAIGRKNHTMSSREDIYWSLIWIGLAGCFNVYIYFDRGVDDAIKFFTGYVVEKGLSIDNIFIFIVIFSYFKIPKKFQHKVLLLGILGAFAARLLFIYFGTYLVQRFDWIIYVFAFFLLYLAFQMLRKNKTYEPEKSRVFKLIKKLMPITHDTSSGNFFIRRQGKYVATPLFFALIMAEATDFVAAMDSIPAIFVITTDPFLVYTSNVFAMLGLRALYFVVARFLKELRYLHYGLVGVLIFLASKILLSAYIKLPNIVSFGMVFSILFIAIIASVWKRKKA